jgi:diadenosine tetraphosphatase ApaH/serine/threonine PP2A family protein phosphatase
MRVLLIADVHANLDALRAVIDAAGSVDAVWCLGDIVGYGPAAAGSIGTQAFNSYAAAAVRWTAGQLNAEQLAWLAGLPAVQVVEGVSLVHGSLVDPAWDYLVSAEQARGHLALQETRLSLVGHSHFALAFTSSGNRVRGRLLEDGESVALDATRLVANPGSAGQPRDGDPRAGYAVLDLGGGRITTHRVAYDPKPVQARIVAAGLPSFLAERLGTGR